MQQEDTKRSDRLRTLIKYLKIKNKDFGDSISVNRHYISHMLSGFRTVSDGMILKIIKRYPMVNPDWLLYGEGEMLLEEKQMVDNNVNHEYRSETGDDPLSELGKVLSEYGQSIKELREKIAQLEKQVAELKK